MTTKHPIPEQALDKHIAFLGSTGSGKTSAAKSAIVEGALARGERVIIIDPTGAWWGLRLTASGKRKGFDVPIFGGMHADYPLRAQDAGILAEAFAESAGSAIFDVSDMTVAERTSWFTKFAETIYRKNRGPIRLIIDEAHLFMPQQGAQAGGGAPAMLHAGNNLVSGGRSRGFRISLLSQRPAKLHKDSLSQVQTLVAMRVMAPQDRKAVKEWMEDQADPTKSREIIASLPSLKPGEGWVWAPMAEILERVTFPMPDTFDSSKAPDLGAGEGPVLAPINLDALKDKLAKVEAEVKANDPKLLRAEINQLRATLQNHHSKTISEPDPAILEKKFNEGFLAGQNKYYPTVKLMKSALEQIQKDASQAAQGIEVVLVPGVKFRGYGEHRDPIGKLVGPLGSDKPLIATDSKRISFVPEKPSKIAWTPAANGDVTIKPAQRQILTILAQCRAGRSMNKLAVFSGKAMSGGFRNYVYALNNAGLVTKEGDDYRITEAGLQTLGDYTPLPVGSELAAHWMFKLKPAEAQILSAIMTANPRALSMQEIAVDVGKQVSGGFRNYVYHLCSLELISGKGSYTANPDLF
jgi:hypothetical protein